MVMLPRRMPLLALSVATAVVTSACGGASEEPTATAESPPPITAAPSPEPSPTPEASADATASPLPPDGEASEPGDGETTAGMDMGAMTGSYGEPADPAEADRVIEVDVDNELAFQPDDFEVAQGEIVTFRITNTGDIEHEFVLGDEEAQQAMAEEMEAGNDHAHAGEMSNAVTIHAGETAELTWHFTEAGTVLVGCHVPGHWEAGMRGSVVVT